MDVQGFGSGEGAVVNGLKVVFRADASLQIGSGHVMRCLALAEALRGSGAECYFISRGHSGNLLDFIKDRGFIVFELSAPKYAVEEGGARGSEGLLAHSHWLGATQAEDAAESELALIGIEPSWIVVDHYALDAQWERIMTKPGRKLMAIDDLADRAHLCEILLDQNLGRLPLNYSSLTSSSCELLMGPSYALLRPEFSMLRTKSLAYRESPRLRRILITMGGVDANNVTALMLQLLKNIRWPGEAHITVVMGRNSPWLVDVQRLAESMHCPTEVVSDVSDMALRMSLSDLAIGGAGSTSWERCCLGLPSLMVILADNQIEIGKALHENGAAVLLGRPGDHGFQKNFHAAMSLLMGSSEALKRMSIAAAKVTNGRGCSAVVSRIMERSKI